MFQIIFQIFDYMFKSISLQKKSNAEAGAIVDGYINNSQAMRTEYEKAAEQIRSDTEQRKKDLETAYTVAAVIVIVLIILTFLKLSLWKSSTK